MPEKLQTFLVTISIIEGRHYAWANMNSTVLIKIDNQKKFTAVKQGTDCPYYNEYFVFEFFKTFEKLVDKNVTLQVIKPGSCVRKQKILGYVTFDIATVWYQKDHQFYHKWAILTAPSEDVVGGTRGYLKIDVSVLFKGEVPKIPRVANTDEIEGNLLLPEGMTLERQRVNFHFDVYEGEDFIKKNLANEASLKKALDNPPTSIIEVTFSGLEVRTSPKKHTSTPLWNERLVLPELFPPLCQRFRVELHQGDVAKKNPTALRFLNLRDIANDKEEGFLPRFGPTFLHFYSPNPLEGFLGKIVFSLNTELLSDILETETHKTTPIQCQEVAPIEKERLFNYDEVTLFAAIFEVSAIDKKFGDKQIAFRLSCGQFPKDVDGDFNLVSGLSKPWQTNKSLYYLNVGDVKPCLYLKINLPDVRKRMYNYNLLANFGKELKRRLDRIEDVFEKNDYKIGSPESDKMLVEALDFALSTSEKYSDIASLYDFQDGTVLDQERLKMCLREMEQIKDIIKSIYDSNNRRKIFQKLEKIYTILEGLIGDVEDWPLVYLWMLAGNKRVAYYTLNPKTILHSRIAEERGTSCGRLQTIYFQIPGEEITSTVEFISMACKMDVVLWMGLTRHWSDFAEMLRQRGFSLTSSEEGPRRLLAEEKFDFQCRAHIFQGRFTPGSDKSGLCDPFVSVILGGQVRETQVLKKTLNPTWDQTLVFKKVTLYGSKKFITENPPQIFVEIYDKDDCCKVEQVGRSTVNPVIKLIEEAYSSPKFPPKLKWYQIYNKFDVSAEFLAAFELLEISQNLEDDEPDDESAILRIPQDIKPNLINYKIEVVFWGVRNLKKVQMMQINKPKIAIECVNSSLISDTLVNGRKNLNFANPIKTFEVIFSEQKEYAPPLCVKMFDCRNFGINVFAGTHVVPIAYFLYRPWTVQERKRKLMEGQVLSYYDDLSMSVESIITTIEAQSTKSKAKMNAVKGKSCLKRFCTKLICCKAKNQKRDQEKKTQEFEDEQWVEKEDFDWWTKFYASLEDTPDFGSSPLPLQYKHKLVIYQNELELQPEFSAFTDMLHSFPMYKGKRTGDETVDEENTVGIFKGSIRIYPWPSSPDAITLTGEPLSAGVFQDFPLNTPLRYVVRVYCIRALGLRPKDLNGKSDPYLYVTLNKQVINDKENCVMRQVNPVFGRCFEFTGVFPQDHTLVIAVYDWDMATADDLIGETRIDLENRFYTKFRAHCGIADSYETSGYCEWRDQQKPVSILDGLCKKFNLSEPEYGATSVTVGYNQFEPRSFTPSGSEEVDRQTMALYALHHWREVPAVGFRLVPEHVETRSLYNPNKPGIEQGKLQLWVDILPCTDLPTPKQVNIAPRKPAPYELRVIIWNTEKIKLDEDDFFTGEKKSDIFIKGWLTRPEHAQFTDVHYRSISGEGNFNWRFIFPFDYLSTENKIVLKEKETFCALDETEFKIPCKLTLQVWDNDTFSGDDFLGCVTLEITRLPRGARSSKKCDLQILESTAPVVNLFKTRRTKGWWPITNREPKTGNVFFAGAIEVEFELLTAEDAEKSPAGLGRDEPQALPSPKRPDISFSWFRNPLRACKYMLKLHKWKIVKAFLVFLLIGFGLIMYYALPSYTVKRILHA